MKLIHLKPNLRPSGLYFDGDHWVIDKSINGIRIHRRTGTSDEQEARRYMAKIVDALFGDMVIDPTWKDYVESLAADRSSWLHRTIRKMRVRGVSSGKGCSMSFAMLKHMVMASNGVCAVSGLPFSLEKPPGAKAPPFAMSVDRIDASKGYHPENVRIVCLAVNMAMREWGEAVFHRVAKATLMKSLQRELAREVGNLGEKSTKSPHDEKSG